MKDESVSLTIRGSALAWIICSMVVFLACLSTARLVAAQTDVVAVTVRLRDVDGLPVRDALLHLVPFAGEPSGATRCQTDDAGQCYWRVPSGVYELLSDAPLDALSQYAVAEGGLRGLGLTVGSDPITYTLTIQPDDNLYFDTEPEAVTPVPFIPAITNTHLHVVPTIVVPTITAQPVITNEVAAETAAIDTAEPTSSSFSFSPSLFLLLLSVTLATVTLWLLRRHARDTHA